MRALAAALALCSLAVLMHRVARTAASVASMAGTGLPSKATPRVSTSRDTGIRNFLLPVDSAAEIDFRFADAKPETGYVRFTSPSGLSVVLSEMNPITPGHAIVAPRRCVARSDELTNEEFLDVWRTVCEVSRIAYDDTATGVNVALLDGASAGQPVPHTHVHVVPRKVQDFAANDMVYDAIDSWSPPFHEAQREAIPLQVPPDDLRQSRTTECMEQEATQYRRVLASWPDLEQGPIPEDHLFAKIKLEGSQLFYASAAGLTVAFVNLKPLTPGHVLVTPRRVAPCLHDLTGDEVDDLFQSVRLIQQLIEQYYGVTASNLGIQDGRDAGQSVPHVHVHVLPRGTVADASGA